MLTKNLAGHRGFLRHMKSGGSGMTSVFEITMVDVKKEPFRSPGEVEKWEVGDLNQENKDIVI